MKSLVSKVVIRMVPAWNSVLPKKHPRTLAAELLAVMLAAFMLGYFIDLGKATAQTTSETDRRLTILEEKIGRVLEDRTSDKSTLKDEKVALNDALKEIVTTQKATDKRQNQAEKDFNAWKNATIGFSAAFLFLKAYPFFLGVFKKNESGSNIIQEK